MEPKTLKILLIEDNDADFLLLEDALLDVSRDGFRLDRASTLQQGLAYLQQNKTDALLLDLGLPDNVDLEGLEQLTDAYPDLPIIILTGFGDESRASRALSLGAQDYLEKGHYDGRVISRAIKYAIERKRLESERDDFENQLRQSQKMDAIGTLAGGIAHDLNNLLTPILASAELGLMLGQEQTEEFFQDIRESAMQAADLVQQILSFSHRTRQAKPEILEITPILKQVLRLIRKTIPSTIHIVDRISDQCGTIVAIKTELQQILLNLCINAYHAMEDNGGRLTITAEIEEVTQDMLPKEHGTSAGRHICIRVKDTGNGIPEDVRSKIFDPFFTTKKAGKGTGLGLAICRGIVKRHGGFITVKSELGKGTEFTVYLPSVPDELPLLHKDNSFEPYEGSERILYVDDQDSLIRTVVPLLEGMGYIVEAFNDPEKALNTIRTNTARFDLIITDQTMPRLTGLQLASSIQHLRDKPLPVILTTGYSEHVTEGSMQEAGIRAILRKPFHVHDLGRMARRIMDAEQEV